MIDVRVQAGDFDPGHQVERLRALGQPAIVACVAAVDAGRDVDSVTIEHYAAMARPELARIADEAAARWPLAGIVLIHRYGRLAPGDNILLAAVAAPDRAAAMAAVAYIADQTRERAPFWRRDVAAGKPAR